MKANNGKGNIPERDLWQTEQGLFNLLNNQYNFTFDCCANKENTKVYQYSDNFEEIKKENVEKGVCWMNPPFSKSLKMFKHFFKVIKKGVAIYRCDNMETKIWQEVIFTNADWIFIPNKRIIYEGMNGSGSRFPSALIGKNVNIHIKLKGVILKICRKVQV
jgi:hypothetical protein